MRSWSRLWKSPRFTSTLRLYTPFYWEGSEFKGQVDAPAGKLMFNLTRVRRLRADWAGVALENFHRFRTREAFEHPFVKGIREPGFVDGPPRGDTNHPP